MENRLMLCVCLGALNILITDNSGETDTNYHTSVSVLHKTATEITSSTETKYTLLSISTAEQNNQCWKHNVETDRQTSSESAQQNMNTGDNTEVTQSASMTAYNLTPCVQHPDWHLVTVSGTNGYVFFQTSNVSHKMNFKIIVQAPSDNVVSFQLKLCNYITLDIEMYKPVYDFITKQCLYYTHNTQKDILTNRIRLKVGFPSGRDDTQIRKLSLYFSAVNKSERNLQIHFQSHSAGCRRKRPCSMDTLPLAVLEMEWSFDALCPDSRYVQTPGWDGCTHLPPFVRNCVTLTPLTDHVIFLSCLHMHIYHGTLRIFPGHCHSEQNHMNTVVYDGTGRECQASNIFPDYFFSGTQNQVSPMSFSLDSSKGNSLGFKFRFSFHPFDLMPQQVPDPQAADGRRWNCSVSVWPELAGHFPCDLVPQCAESEDEARCFYTSEKCGLNKIDLAGRCYHIDSRRYTMLDSKRRCRQHGASLVSLETYNAWNEVLMFLEHTHASKVWIGLTATRRTTGTASLNALYKNTWHWESSYVAYYLRASQIDDQQCIFIDRCLKGCGESPCYKARNVECTFYRTYGTSMCEFPSPLDRHHMRSPVSLPVPNDTSMVRVPLVTCPLQHVTHEILACDQDSLCRNVEDAEVLPDVYYTMPLGPKQPYFYCDMSGRFISYSLVCDFRKDCASGDDEEFCVHPACTKHKYDCGQGQCVDMKKRCDGYTDCMTNLDEEHCPKRPFSHYAIKPPAVINFDKPGGFTVTPLPDNITQCPETHFQCPDEGYCLPVYVRCNDVNDCPGHEDEAGCDNYTCPGFYRCRGSNRTICMHVNHLCDGRPQCPQHDDELMCDMKTCPSACTCYGLAFICTRPFNVSSFPQVRYLQARRSGLNQADVEHNIMLIHLGVQKCDWNNLTDFKLPNLHSLDLSDNLLCHVTFSHFQGMPKLRRLSLADNPLSGSHFLAQRTYEQSLLVVFNFSQVQMDTLDMSIWSAVMPELQILDLSHSGIKSLQGQNVFHTLRVLDLRGCPVSDFTPDFMKSMSNLERVFASNFKLCCSAVLPDFFKGDCLAPSDEISSCDALLKSTIYRFALAVFALLAIMGNFSSFVYRLCFSLERIKIGFAVFVLHLCVSDLFMGVYLAIIGTADQMYAGIYVWREKYWKRSTVCSFAGSLSFLSSEVSAFLVCLITLDRFIVLHFPFSQIRFGATSAHFACVIIWILGITLATVPLLPVTSHWEFYRQTGICIPLPVTRAEFAGHGYSFSVMIVCNLVLFILIAIGQSLIYWSVISNSMSEHRTEIKNKGSESVKSKEAVIARRLLSIAISDFLCWFPIGLCGLLAAINVAIPGEVNVGMAIFVLPLNSALNPFLYTLSIMLEKRQKSQKLRPKVLTS